MRQSIGLNGNQKDIYVFVFFGKKISDLSHKNKTQKTDWFVAEISDQLILCEDNWVFNHNIMKTFFQIKRQKQ